MHLAPGKGFRYRSGQQQAMEAPLAGLQGAGTDEPGADWMYPYLSLRLAASWHTNQQQQQQQPAAATTSTDQTGVESMSGSEQTK